MTNGKLLLTPEAPQLEHQGAPAQLDGFTEATSKSPDTDPRYHEAYSPIFPPGTEPYKSMELYEPTKPPEAPAHFEFGGKAGSTGPEKP